MAIFKCKICGGSLEIDNAQSVATCEYCGTKQTLPKLDDERRANLYDRANHFRRNNDFDKAMGIYENILNEDNTDAEAYWSLVLCRYGIEYVEDPATRKRVPTVNRAQFTSIFDDEDYKSAIANADGYQREIYEAEANAINELQKGILAISQKEEPFDVFVCYKETDASGRRTQDSVLATELYHELTREGFKVFFSRITLEDKLGVAYEPYIFAALHSAKVMVVLGTRPEHFNAVWVKNEWSRFLALIKNGAKKTLIPAYRDMDPYDLPEEFSHLQAQDMSKLGFMQDLTRGIKKIVEADAPKATVKETIVATAAAINVSPLLKRAFMFLEDGDFDRADEFCEQVLNQDPENAQAYLGKLMADLHIKHQTGLANCAEPFDNNKNYQKVVRFADASLTAELREYISTIHHRVRVKEENERIERARQIEQNRIAEEKAHIEKQRQAEINRIEAEKRAKRNKKIAMIVSPIVVAVIAFVIILNSIIIPNGKYNDAVALMNDGKYEEAISTFEALDGYKDSAAMLEKCNVSMYGIRGWNILKNTFIGDTFVLGTYEQNTDDSDIESIEWRVLDIDGGKLLLISSMVIDCYWYNTNYVDTTWESSSIRKWLNNEFIHNAFTEAEKNLIYSISRTDSPSSTKDQMFLLSEEDALKYFDSDNERKCTATPYAEVKGCYINSQTYSCEWWLRENSYASNNISYVDLFGRIREKEYDVGDNTIGIRPAMWIDVRKWE